LLIVDVTLDNLSSAPAEVRSAVYWELDTDGCADPMFEKEEWFSSTLLEWGTCGKLALDGDEEVVGFAQFAPASLFPRLQTFRCGRISPDAVYLSYCYVDGTQRGRGLGGDLIRAVARDVVGRGFAAVEAIGDEAWDGGWVLPAPFLGASGFSRIREDPRFPLLRLDVTSARQPLAEAAALAPPG